MRLYKTKKLDVESFRPILFNLSLPNDYKNFYQLVENSNESLTIQDNIDDQILELLNNRNLDEVGEDSKRIEGFLKRNNVSKEVYGIWVYYPWLNLIIHTLSKEDFIELRTVRNRYKVTQKEYLELQKKEIAIVGLSVGNAVALTIATERICSKIILADFDHLELSNLNRVRAGLQHLGIEKSIITARQIAEIDPFIDLRIIRTGIDTKSVKDLVTLTNKPDIIVEVCDNLKTKLLIREFAKSNRIPVVMDTNDRGMIDIERFDLEPDRPSFHGLIKTIKSDAVDKLSADEKFSLILKILDEEKISERLKMSMNEIGRTIKSWPQLASGVTLGGAITTNVCRKILLDKHNRSGRYYIDLDKLLN